MPKASDLKRGMAIEHNGKLLIAKEVEVSSPSARGAATLYKVRFADIQTGLKVEDRFKGDDSLTEIELVKRPASFSYEEGDEVIFMDNEDYSQYHFNKQSMTDELLFIHEAIEGLLVVMVDGSAVGVELPQSVEMVITDTPPSIKGASASARTKPAEFATGLIVQVPEYIAPGDKIRINTADKKFMSRAD
ncbi:elongation factor P-like protein YeiP [Corallincola platygyrae]|uniref:Elongation factor P-like protein n=1 Tax=Corallincola platygyrae TaxID=1193278 RepID=A0ABW4XJY4_9GAMM